MRAPITAMLRNHHHGGKLARNFSHAVSPFGFVGGDDFISVWFVGWLEGSDGVGSGVGGTEAALGPRVGLLEGAEEG